MPPPPPPPPPPTPPTPPLTSPPPEPRSPPPPAPPHHAPPRQYELRELSPSSRERRAPARKDYAPPETLPPARSPRLRSRPRSAVHHHHHQHHHHHHHHHPHQALPPVPPTPPSPALASDAASTATHATASSSSTSSSSAATRRSHDSDLVDVMLRRAVSAVSPSTSLQSALSARSAPPVLTAAGLRAAAGRRRPGAAADVSAEAALVGAAACEALFRTCLTNPASVDVDELRRLVWAHGTPDTPWVRPVAWKLLLEYLPPDRGLWQRVLAARRARYWATVAEVSVDPTGDELRKGDHPLSERQDSQWREYFEDAELREDIRRDVDRTHPDLHRMGPLRDCLERVLFVYAKLHPDLRYRQGMNELAAPLLLVFAEERGVDISDVEADAYFCFDIMMAEMGRCYTPVETETEGITRQLSEFRALFRIKDPDLERHFETLKIEPRFFALRWIRLWLARELDLPDCLSLWDSFLTSEQRLGWVRYVCVAMLVRIREALLAADFVDCMKLLLHYPPCDVAEILRTADRLRTSNVVIVRKAKR